MSEELLVTDMMAGIAHITSKQRLFRPAGPANEPFSNFDGRTVKEYLSPWFDRQRANSFKGDYRVEVSMHSYGATCWHRHTGECYSFGVGRVRIFKGQNYYGTGASICLYYQDDSYLSKDYPITMSWYQLCQEAYRLTYPCIDLGQLREEGYVH